jgi:voltage-gated potassium channel
MAHNPVVQLRVALGLVLLTVLIGCIGYILIEGWEFLDALYMTVISITTTGFKEVQPLSDAGKIFTLVLIILGVGSIAYTGGRAVQVFLEMQLFRRKQMEKKIAGLTGHYIVCGYGKMGKYICEALLEQRATFVVIEKGPERTEALRQSKYPFIEGDATTDETLLQAGVMRARGLVAALSNDADNVFTTLSAKVLNPKIFVVARAVEEESESKMAKAGANRVVKPYEAAGTKMAELLLRPGVTEYFDIVSRDKRVDLNIEEVQIAARSPLIGKTLAESLIRQELNIIIVSITRPDGTIIYNPTSTASLGAGDHLIAIGEGKNLTKLGKLCLGE